MHIVLCNCNCVGQLPGDCRLKWIIEWCSELGAEWNSGPAPLCILPFWFAARSLPLQLVFRHPPTPPKLLWPFFCPIAFQQAGNLFARDKGFQPKETKQRLKDANTAGVPLYIANGKMAIKRTKINGNIRVGINSLWGKHKRAHKKKMCSHRTRIQFEEVCNPDSFTLSLPIFHQFCVIIIFSETLAAGVLRI